MSELGGRRLVAADLATGIVLVLGGLAALAAALAMPTYAERGADPLTAPGIFPTFVSATLVLLGVFLTVRALRARSAGSTESTETPRPYALRFGLGFLLMTAAIVAIGRAPYPVVMGAFCLAYCACFVSWRGTRREIAGRAAATAVTALIVAVLIPLLFEHVFLVRLP